MGDHRTLDEFARGRSEDDPEAADEAIAAGDEQPETITDGADSETEMPDAESPSSDDGAVEPPATTYRWRPEGVNCEGCGAVVERQWRDSGEFVCVDCKDW